MTQEAMPRQKSAAKPILIGCGVGCCILIFIGVIGVISVVALMRRGLDQAGQIMTQEAMQGYEQFRMVADIEPEKLEQLDGLADDIQAEDSSFWVRMMGALLLQEVVADGEVTEQELERVSRLRQFIAENPQAGMADMMAFVERHPEFSETLEQIEEMEGLEQPR